MSLYLHGLGTALPPHCISQRDAATGAVDASCQTDEQRRLLPVLYRKAGVQSRHSVLLNADAGPPIGRQSFFHAARDAEDRGPTTAARMQQYEQSAGPLALAAARAAIVDAAIEPAAITHLITVSCSGFSAPGFDLELVREAPLSPATARTHVGYMGCQGALNALRVARGFTTADPRACVLVCALELCSLHHQYGWDPDQIVANALFADGSAAAVCRGRRPEQSACWQVIDQASTVVPDTADAMQWRIGDHGFQMRLSPRVPELIQQRLRPWLDAWLAGHGLSAATVGSWAVHPGGPRILSACAEGLRLPLECFRESQQLLAELGNMSSPTLLFILDRLRRKQAALPCVALGFGPGLTIEAALVGEGSKSLIA
jgi:predicted naringenin-chalcone synthase